MWSLLFYKDHLPAICEFACLYPIEVNSAGDLFPRIVSTIPDCGVIPGGLIFIHQSANQLPFDIIYLKRNHSSLRQLIGYLGCRIVRIRVVLVESIG